MLKNGKHSPCGSTNSYLKAGAGVEPHLIHCSPKAIVYVSRCSVEKQFSGQRQSPVLVPRPKELNQWRTCSSSIEGLSQQSVDNRWKSTTLPRHRSHALPHPKYSSCAAGCSTMLISPILHTPCGEWGEKLKKKKLRNASMSGFVLYHPSALAPGKHLGLWRTWPSCHLQIPKPPKESPVGSTNKVYV